MKIVELDHPLVRHKLGLMRERSTGPKMMRELCAELAGLLAYEATRSLPLTPCEVDSWAGPVRVGRVDQTRLRVVPILRAGLGMLPGVLQLLPDARVGVVGVQRDEATLQARVYCDKLGQTLAGHTALVIDPMLATGGTLLGTVELLKAAGCSDIRGLFLVAAPEGLDRLRAAHPDVEVYTAAIDERLNEAGYILPGLGDAGDRIFGVAG